MSQTGIIFLTALLGLLQSGIAEASQDKTTYIHTDMADNSPTMVAAVEAKRDPFFAELSPVSEVMDMIKALEVRVKRIEEQMEAVEKKLKKEM